MIQESGIYLLYLDKHKLLKVEMEMRNSFNSLKTMNDIIQNPIFRLRGEIKLRQQKIFLACLLYVPKILTILQSQNGLINQLDNRLNIIVMNRFNRGVHIL